MSAKRDRDFAGYMPFKAGSTILANASISCSCGVAHLTRDCSDLGLELDNRENKNSNTTHVNQLPEIANSIITIQRAKIQNKIVHCLPVQWLPTSQKL